MRAALAFVLVSTGCLGPSLFVETAGDGKGIIRSQPDGIDCDDECGAQLSGPVTLSAIPADGSLFLGWDGACSGTEPECTLDVAGDLSATARFGLESHEVSVVVNGAGRVTSEPAAIDCGANCTATVSYGTRLRLLPVADDGIGFVSWDALECPGRDACVITIVEPRTVVARFEPYQLLQVDEAGSGHGRVTSTPVGIGVGASTSAWFAWGTSVTLQAAEDPMSTFSHWEGDCTGNAPTCVVEMTRAIHATAVFGIRTFLTVQKQGSGLGTVSSNPIGISCGAACSAQFSSWPVTLTATPGPGSRFTGWSGGGCTGTSSLCTVSSDQQAATVIAVFEPYEAPCTTTVTASETATAFNARLTSSNAVVCLAGGVTITGAVAVGANGITIRASTANTTGYLQNTSGNALSLGTHTNVRLVNLDILAQGSNAIALSAGGEVTLVDTTVRCEGAGCRAAYATGAGLIRVVHGTLLAGTGTQSTSLAAEAVSGGELQLVRSSVTSYDRAISVVGGRVSALDTAIESSSLASGTAAITITNPTYSTVLDRNLIVVGGHPLLAVGGALTPTLAMNLNMIRKHAGTPAGSQSPITSTDAATTVTFLTSNTVCNEGTSTTDGAFALPLISGAYDAAGSSIAAPTIGNCP